MGVHPPKLHQIDIGGRRHHIWGRWWPCDSVAVFPGGLHLSRAMLGHDQIAHMDAYFLPNLGLIANRFQAHGGGPHLGWYIDIARIVPGPACWQATDLYLDVEVQLDGRIEVLDTDEYLAAVAEGHLNREEASFALTKPHELMNGLARHGGSLLAWLTSLDIALPESGKHPG